ncbi:MAG: OsmC family protein [Saprospiraceae bacterium]|nr:OsmC family protein [Saprospiraceae bacterium]
MTPNEFLLAGLGECTAITLKMYANRKGWAVSHISVTLSLEEMTPTDKTTRISRQISIEGDLTQEQRSRMMQIADLCPVHKILTHQIDITTA